MRPKKAFTLIELLVVIAIIALLMAILAPALNKTKELARQVVCKSLVRSYGLANITYAASNNGRLVPFSQPHNDPALTWDERWCENEEFRANLTVNQRVLIEDSGWNDAFIYPDELRCPSQKIGDPDLYTQEIEASEGWKVIMSYGMNVEMWRGNGNLSNDSTWWPRGGVYGYKEHQIRNPAEVMMFIDNNYYQARYAMADYETFWDVYGDVIKRVNMGQTCYRHSGKAGLCFFDGHAENLKKDEVWNKDNDPPTHNVYLRKPEKLWDVSTRGLIY